MEWEREIFTFGSNEAGRHGAGAAKHAVIKHGAVLYQGYGLQGNSFAIPTKDKKMKTLSYEYIKHYVQDFLDFANQHPSYRFNVTKVGCGLAGLDANKIALFFKGSPINVYLPQEFVEILKINHPVSFDKNDKPL